MAIFYTDSASFNSLQVTGSTILSASSGIALQLKSSGSTVFSISGSSGEIFNISDTVSPNLFSVSSGSTSILSIGTSKNVQISGSLTVTGSITGSLFGTSSWAVSASWAPTQTSASYALTASYALNSGGALSGGTDGYIPLWSGSSALQSSIVRQVLNTVHISGSANITGSLQINLNGVNQYFAVSVTGQEKLRVNTEGTLQLAPQNATPTAVSGGLFYSGSDEFYLGFNN